MQNSNIESAPASNATPPTNDVEKGHGIVVETPPTAATRPTPRQWLQILGTFIVFLNTW